MMGTYYLYILHSEKFDSYYVGSSSNPWQRLQQHNETPKCTYTSKYRPWSLAAIFQAVHSRSDAIKAEKFVKSQKSRIFIEKLVETDFVPSGNLAQLVRVPHVRD
ncbi:hypothetical protein VC82_1602 [Flagellimonas lutaonensis]|uniref:GIY-YIG domain-containing protein n=2 Tax=Flagellimonas lutaonensis TaxID=516051 RepID=A0A0D5YSI2_9FLAO|nr:hypothetical protein VC82_1602 [Allomuricauda lutaonensis]